MAKNNSPSTQRRKRRRALEKLAIERAGARAHGEENTVARLTTDIEIAFECRRKDRAGRTVKVADPFWEVFMRTDGSGDSLVRPKSKVGGDNGELEAQMKTANEPREVRYSTLPRD